MKVFKFLVLVGALLCIQPVMAEVLSHHQTITYKPTCENKLDTNFWFEEIEGDHTVYWEFIEVYDTVKESIANLAARLRKYMSKHRIQKLIVTKSPRPPRTESG